MQSGHIQVQPAQTPLEQVPPHVHTIPTATLRPTSQGGGEVGEDGGEVTQHEHPRRHQQRHHAGSEQQQVRQRARRLQRGRGRGVHKGSCIVLG